MYYYDICYNSIDLVVQKDQEVKNNHRRVIQTQWQSMEKVIQVNMILILFASLKYVIDNQTIYYCLVIAHKSIFFYYVVYNQYRSFKPGLYNSGIWFQAHVFLIDQIIMIGCDTLSNILDIQCIGKAYGLQFLVNEDIMT